MKFIKEYEYLNHIQLCGGPLKIIAPYGINSHVLKHLIETSKSLPVQIITQQEQPELESNGFELRTWKKMHAKLFIGTNGAVWGSWNFNLIHPKRSTMREIAEYCMKSEPKYSELNKQFNYFWNRAGGWNK